MLGFMSVTGIVGLGNISHLRLAVQLPDEIYAGTPTQITLRLSRSRGLFPAYLLEILFLSRTIPVTLLPRGEEVSRHLLVTFDKRGSIEIDPPHVTSPFPIGFFVRSLPLQVETHCTVFPKPLPTRGWGGDAERRSRGERERQRPGSGGDLYAIDDYSGRESLRHVHWRLSARHDDLKVKRFAAVETEPLVVDPSLLQGDTESRLGMAVFLINRLHRLGRPVGLRLGERLILPAHGREHRLQMLRELALYDSP